MIKIRIPTVQYGYVEFDFEGTPEEAQIFHDTQYKAFNSNNQDGLDDKTWRAVLDRYLTENTMEADMYEGMNEKQKSVIQEIKKAFARLEK